MIYSSEMRFLRRSPVQTFILVPLAVLAFELALGRLNVQPAGVLLMLWGFAQYRFVGRFRVRFGGGGPGLSGAPPERLVDSGIYAWMRNPMYLGHIVYMIGVAVLFESWDDALLFRTLARLRFDVPVFDSVEDLRWKGPRPEFERMRARLRFAHKLTDG